MDAVQWRHVIGCRQVVSSVKAPPCDDHSFGPESFSVSFPFLQFQKVKLNIGLSWSVAHECERPQKCQIANLTLPPALIHPQLGHVEYLRLLGLVVGDEGGIQDRFSHGTIVEINPMPLHRWHEA